MLAGKFSWLLTARCKIVCFLKQCYLLKFRQPLMFFHWQSVPINIAINQTPSKSTAFRQMTENFRLNYGNVILSVILSLPVVINYFTTKINEFTKVTNNICLFGQGVPQSCFQSVMENTIYWIFLKNKKLFKPKTAKMRTHSLTKEKKLKHWPQLVRERQFGWLELM